MTNPQLTVWHDGDCPMCQREIAFMRRLDRNKAFNFIDLTGPDAAASCPLDPALMLARFHAQEDGKLLSGAAAFAAMWRVIPSLRPLGLIARNSVVLAIMEKLYILVLRVRPRLQRYFRERGW